MKKNSKKKKLMAAAAALALIAAISGTFAWLTAQDQRINRAESAAVSDDSVVLKEEWEPVPLVAGTKAKKEVSVSNTGNASVFVRISYEEVLKHLTNKGDIVYNTELAHPTAKYNPTTATTDLNVDMPVDFNAQSFFADGYSVVPAANLTFSDSTADPKVKLLAKGGKSLGGLTGTWSENLETRIAYEYYTHPDNATLNPGDTGYDASKNKYQSMSCDLDYDYEAEASEDGATWTYEVTNVQYGYYPNGYKNTVANWAVSSLAPKGQTGAPTGHALLDTASSRYGVSYDYTAAALGLTSIPAPARPTVADQKPIAASTEYGVQADTTGLGKNHIRIGYGSYITTVTTFAANNWVYNDDDGWFYYTSPVPGGATTNDLMKELIFESEMGKEYTNASYDLVVKMEAIQATADALTDSTGWGLASTGETGTIASKLAATVATP